MVSSDAKTIITAASISFFLGWTLKKYQPLYYQTYQSLKGNIRSSVNKTKFVIVVRADLAMTKGKLAAQCSHAAVSCYKEGMNICPDIVKLWESKGQPKIILKTDSEESLKKLAKKAANEGLIAAIIRDAGRTELPSGTTTVLGIGPGYVDNVNKITSELKLL